MKRSWFWWLLTALWAANIFYASTPGFNSFRSASVLVAIFEHFHIAAPPVLVSVCNTIIRKSAHIVEYAILTWLLYRAACGADPLIWRPDLARWCVLTAAAYALTDEFHQLFVPGRGGSPVDWGVDCAGSLFAAHLLYRSLRLLPRKPA